MTCDEIRELLPAYALGVLDSDEHDAVEAHLGEGREHDEELTELRATVFALDRHAGYEAPEPSPALAERIRDIVATDAVTPPEPLRPRGDAASTGFVVPAWGAVAAAIALLLIFGAGWLAGSTLGGSQGEFDYIVQGAGGEVLEMAGPEGGDTVTVTMAGIETAPEGSAYQLWAVREDEWVSIGVCNTNENGWWRGDFDYAYQEGEQIALTVEPAGGSESPTSEPLLRSEF